MITIHGAMTALVTPFRDGRVDYARLKDNVHEQIDAGIDGLVPCGTTGESPTLSHDEHDRVIEAVVKAADGRVPVIAGTGSNSTHEALRLTEHAKAVGADACLSVNPYYNKPSQEGMYRHFMTIADTVDLPLMLYNIPGRCGVALTVETMHRLASHPRIIGVKEATGSLDVASEVVALCGDESFIVVSGDDSLTLPLMSVGAVGVISVTSNLQPARVVEMVHAAADGRFDAARQRHLSLFGLFRALFLEGNPATVKAAMALCGMDTGEVRSPLAPVSAGCRDALEAVLRQQGIGVTAKA